MAFMIPPKLYVGFQKKNSDGLRKGFATPDGDDSAAKSRKSTVDRWKSKEEDTEVWENEPIEGFKVLSQVRRWTSNNVVWKISDPRGAVFEIPSANMSYLLQNTSLVGGLIEGKCVWVRDGSNNILVPENSEEYKEAFEQTVVRMDKVSLYDVDPGDRVLLHDGDEVTYLGLFRCLQKNWHRNNGNYFYSFEQVKKRYFYIVHGEKGDKLGAKSSVKVGMIKEKAAQPLTDEERWNVAFDNLPEKSNYSSQFDSDFVFFAPEKFTTKEAEVFTEPVNDVSGLKDKRCLLVDGAVGNIGATVLSEVRGDPSKVKVFKIESGPLFNEKSLQNVYTQNSNTGYSRYGSRSKVSFEVDPSTVDWMKVRVKLPDTPYEMDLRIRHI